MEKKELETFIGIGGQPRYKCPFFQCGYDSYSEREVYKHWISSHRDAEPMMADSTLFDQDDKPIKKEIHVPEVFRAFRPSPARSQDPTQELRDRRKA